MKGAASKRTEFVYNIDDVANRSAIRYGDYKLIKGGAGAFNGWYPLPKLHESKQVFHLEEEENVPKMPEYMLFNIKDDPTEHNDLSPSRPDILAKLKERLDYWLQSLVPAQNPAGDPASNPKHFGGNWSPGWC